MFKYILLILFVSGPLCAETVMVTDKSLQSRNPERICKELNWKLAARSCGVTPKKFKTRAVYDECTNDMSFVVQVLNIPTEDADIAGPHQLCVVKAKKKGQLHWVRRHRIFADRVITEQDKYASGGSLERLVITSKGTYTLTKKPNEETMSLSKGSEAISNLQPEDYFSFIKGKQSFADLAKITDSGRVPASTAEK